MSEDIMDVCNQVKHEGDTTPYRCMHCGDMIVQECLPDNCTGDCNEEFEDSDVAMLDFTE